MMAKNTISQQNENKVIVEAMYKALAKGDTENVAIHLACDLEWWFHGPPQCQHMMRLLTGKLEQPEFRFEPRSVIAIDEERVIAEGWEGAQAYWVHVWTIKDGLITQFREYFNTSLIVRDLRIHNGGAWELSHSKMTLWESQQPSRKASQSMPGLVLAI